MWSDETDPGGLPGTFPALVVVNSARESMTHDTDTAPTGRNDDGESLTKIPVSDLTEFERREVIPTRDFIVVGYDSSYSDAEESTKRIDDPAHVKNLSRHGGVKGSIAGIDASDTDRKIGLSLGAESGTIRTSESSGRIGTVLWVAYPGDTPTKKTYDVTLRALTGNWSKTGEADDPEEIDDLTELTVDRQSYDNIDAPPKGERRIEDVPVGEDRRQRRVAVDMTRRITVVGDVDEDEVVERVFDRVNPVRGTKKVRRREDLPAIGEHITERSRQQGGNRNERRAVRYWVEDVTVERVDD